MVGESLGGNFSYRYCCSCSIQSQSQDKHISSRTLPVSFLFLRSPAERIPFEGLGRLQIFDRTSYPIAKLCLLPLVHVAH